MNLCINYTWPKSHFIKITSKLRTEIPFENYVNGLIIFAKLTPWAPEPAGSSQYLQEPATDPFSK
jgi:hypothetical protein